MWTPMVKVIPPGESGNVKVDHVVVSPHDAAMAGLRRQRLAPGPLARLLVDGDTMMSDGAEEHASNWERALQISGKSL